ncbi:MAG: hypothetical protein ACO3NL_14965, partial [Phycisphaerales bacterium]
MQRLGDQATGLAVARKQLQRNPTAPIDPECAIDRLVDLAHSAPASQPHDLASAEDRTVGEFADVLLLSLEMLYQREYLLY